MCRTPNSSHSGRGVGQQVTVSKCVKWMPTQPTCMGSGVKSRSAVIMASQKQSIEWSCNTAFFPKKPKPSESNDPIDGVTTMSGHVSGVSAQLQQLYPNVKYFTHCRNYALNLVVIAGCNSVPDVCNFMGTFKELTSIFKYSVKWKH